MEKKSNFLGIPSLAWGVIGILALVTGALLICALVGLMFGMDIGEIVSL